MPGVYPKTRRKPRKMTADAGVCRYCDARRAYHKIATQKCRPPKPRRVQQGATA